MLNGATKYFSFLVDLRIFCVIMFLEDSGVTSYRGVETISCVGMQLIAEPDLGLCDNLKPNRFLGTERKRFFKDLALARSFIFQGWFHESTTTIGFSMEGYN